MKAFLASILLSVSGMLFAQTNSNVIFIDSGSIITPSPTSNTQLEFIAFRYVPIKGNRSPEIPANGSLYPVFESLAKSGKFNLLFYASRSINNDNATRFHALENRPVFTVNSQANQALTNRNFGLLLLVEPTLTHSNYFALKLNGSFSWSPELLDHSISEKYIVLGFRLAGLIQPGLVRETSGDEEEEAEPSGINLRTLFSRKKNKKAAEAQVAAKAPDLSWLDTERREIVFDATHYLPPDQWLTLTYPEKTTSGEPQYLCFLLKASAN